MYQAWELTILHPGTLWTQIHQFITEISALHVELLLNAKGYSNECVESQPISGARILEPRNNSDHAIYKNDMLTI